MERRKKKSLSSSLHFFPVRRYLSQQVSYVSQQWRTSVTHSSTAHVSLFCFYQILTLSVTYYWTDAGQHGICLFDFSFHWHRWDRKKYFLEEIITIYKPVGQRENCKNIYIPFFMYTVTPLVKADVSWISTHLLKSFPYTILKKRKESKHKGKGMKIQQVCSFNQYIVYVKYCFNHSLRRLNSSGQSVLNPSKNSPDWTWLESRPTYLDRGTMRRSRHDIFSLLGEEFTDYYVDKYLATEPSKNMKTPIP